MQNEAWHCLAEISYIVPEKDVLWGSHDVAELGRHLSCSSPSALNKDCLFNLLKIPAHPALSLSYNMDNMENLSTEQFPAGEVMTRESNGK